MVKVKRLPTYNASSVSAGIHDPNSSFCGSGPYGLHAHSETSVYMRSREGDLNTCVSTPFAEAQGYRDTASW